MRRLWRRRSRSSVHHAHLSALFDPLWCPFLVLVRARPERLSSGIKNANAKDMIKEADTNNEGQIDFLAFANLMSRKMAEVLLSSPAFIVVPHPNFLTTFPCCLS